jgi:ParB family chromosome partitioning protein
MSIDKGKRLGRGLEALISRAPTRVGAGDVATRGVETAPTDSRAAESPYRVIPLKHIRPNPSQPRKEFRPEELADLESSLRVNGLLQPITVRPAPRGDGFELIAGERRLRAAQRLGWSEIAAVVRDVDDRLLLSLAMVENLQRSDLKPIEEAEGYDHLIRDFSLTQQEVAEIVGKDRSTIANTLRLLALPASVRRLVGDCALTVGHARALLSLGDERSMADLARAVVAEGLSVREVERRARNAARSTRKGGAGSAGSAAPDARSAELRRLEDQLRKRLGTDLKIVQTAKDKGEVRIPFYSNEDFERLLELMLGTERVE